MTTAPNGKISPTAARSMVYRWLYRAFQYPTEFGGLPLLEKEVSNMLPTLDGFTSKDKALRFVDLLNGADMEELQVEYVRLFDYRPTCPPCESAYRRDIKPGELMSALMAIYRQGGIECDRNFSPDHICVELEFMHYLTHLDETSRDGDARRCRDLQKLFLEDHLMRWVPGFCEDLEGRSGFAYGLLGKITADYLLAEGRVFGVTS